MHRSDFKFMNLCAFLEQNPERFANNVKRLHNIEFDIPELTRFTALDILAGRLTSNLSRQHIALSLLRDVKPILEVRYPKIKDRSKLIKVLYFVCIHLLSDKTIKTYFTRSRAEPEDYKSRTLLGKPDQPVRGLYSIIEILNWANDELRKMTVKSPILQMEIHVRLKEEFSEASELLNNSLNQLELPYKTLALLETENDAMVSLSKAWLKKYIDAWGPEFVHGLVDSINRDLILFAPHLKESTKCKSLKNEITRFKVPNWVPKSKKSKKPSAKSVYKNWAKLVKKDRQ